MYFKSGAKQAKLKSENDINNELVHTISLQSYKLQNHYKIHAFYYFEFSNTHYKWHEHRRHGQNPDCYHIHISSLIAIALSYN